jgi:hypothetical protein
MRGFVRIGLTVGALGLGLALAGCEDFDPTAIFDTELFNTKKPLPGHRVPVFPEGTPGVSQGVPAEMVKGYQGPSESAAAPETTATATAKQAAAEPSEAKPKPKPRVKPRTLAKPAERPTQTAGAAPEQAAQAAPAAQSQSPGSPPASPPAQQSAPAAGGWPGSPRASGGVAWPDPPPVR